MSRRTTAVLAWSVGGLTIALMAFTVILYAANWSDVPGSLLGEVEGPDGPR